MRFSTTDAVTYRGAKYNEDSIGWGPDYLFAIDGATPLYGGPPDEVHRFSRELAEYLNAHVLDNKPLRDILVDAADYLHGRFTEGVSASIGIVRRVEHAMEILRLGDIAITYESADGFHVLQETVLTKLDQENILLMHSYMSSTGCSLQEARERAAPAICATRELRGIKYWSFDTSKSWYDHVDTDITKMADVRDVSLVSDGFGQLVYTFGIYPSYVELHKTIRDEGVANLLYILVDQQLKDPSGIKHPRFKFRDDTSAIHANIYK